ncbi:hypothetical protein [Georgenia muralis]
MIEDLSGASVSVLFVTLLLGGAFSVMIQVFVEWVRSRFGSDAETRAEQRARAREDREESRVVARENREETRQAERERREESRQVGREQREEAGARLAAARRREEAAAEEIDRVSSRLVDAVIASRRSKELASEQRRIRTKMRQDIDELSVQAAYLPGDLRARVLQIQQMFRYADELGADSWNGMAFHYDGVHTIARCIGEEAHELIAAFLRQSPRIEPTSKKFRELELALQALFRHKEEDFAPEVAEEEDQRRRWLKANPGWATILGEPEPG